MTRGSCPSRRPPRRQARPSRAYVLRASWLRLLAGVFALLLHASRLFEAALLDHAICEHRELVHAAPESSNLSAEGGDARAGELEGERLDRADRYAEQGSEHAGE